MAYLTDTIPTSPSRLTFSTWFRISQADYDAYVTDATTLPVTHIYQLFALRELGIEHILRMELQKIGSVLNWRFIFRAWNGDFIFNYEGQSNTAALPASTIIGDTWYHFFMSVLTEGNEFEQRCFFVLNRANITQSRADTPESPPLGVWTQWNTPTVSGISWDEDPAGSGQSNRQKLIILGEDVTLITYNMGIGGNPFTFPAVFSPFIDHGRVRHAYTQLWLGTFIEPTSANLNNFAVPSGSVIKPPTNVAIAQQVYGASDYWFYRSKIDNIQFETNRGTAGAVTVVGTPPEDFTPGPGQTASLALAEDEEITAPFAGEAQNIRPFQRPADGWPKSVGWTRDLRAGQELWRRPSRIWTGHPDKSLVIKIGNSRTP